MSKKKISPFHFRYDTGIYGQIIHVFFLHDDAKFAKKFRTLFTKEAEKDFRENTEIFTLDSAGKCSKTNGYVILRFKEWNSWTIDDFEIISHELFHATHYILKRVGMTLSDETDEAYAYLNSYLTEKFYSLLLSKTK